MRCPRCENSSCNVMHTLQHSWLRGLMPLLRGPLATVESSQGRFTARGMAILPGGASSGDAADTGELRRQGQPTCLYSRTYTSRLGKDSDLQVVVDYTIQRAEGPLQLGRSGVTSRAEQGDRLAILNVGRTEGRGLWLRCQSRHGGNVMVEAEGRWI